MFHNLQLHKTIAFSLTVIVASALAYLTLMPLSVSDSIPGSDKLHHLIGFAALTLPCAVLYPSALVWLVPMAVLFGGALEVIQPFAGRHGEVLDFYADTIGVLIGTALGLSLYRHKLFRKR